MPTFVQFGDNNTFSEKTAACALSSANPNHYFLSFTEVRARSKHVVRLGLVKNSSVDLSDPAVMEDVLKQADHLDFYFVFPFHLFQHSVGF